MKQHGRVDFTGNYYERTEEQSEEMFKTQREQSPSPLVSSEAICVVSNLVSVIVLWLISQLPVACEARVFSQGLSLLIFSPVT